MKKYLDIQEATAWFGLEACDGWRSVHNEALRCHGIWQSLSGQKC